LFKTLLRKVLVISQIIQHNILACDFMKSKPSIQNLLNPCALQSL